jgi:hypothetical protein
MNYVPGAGRATTEVPSRAAMRPVVRIICIVGCRIDLMVSNDVEDAGMTGLGLSGGSDEEGF